MWDFLNNVLEQAGFVAALYVLTMVGVALAGRMVWKHIVALNAKLVAAETRATKATAGTAAAVEKVRTEESGKRGKMREAHDEERRRTDAEHAAELLAVAEERRAEAERFGDRIETRADRHSDQMIQLVEKSTKHIERIDSSIGNFSAALDVLIRLDGR